jgi:hypothetical protein
LSDWAEKFFAVTYGYMSEVVLSFFENLTFFFIKRILKDSGHNRIPRFQNPINPHAVVRNKNGQFHLWRILQSIFDKNFSPIGQS